MTFIPPGINRNVALGPKNELCYGFFMNLSKFLLSRRRIDSFLNIGASDFL